MFAVTNNIRKFPFILESVNIKTFEECTPKATLNFNNTRFKFLKDLLESDTKSIKYSRSDAFNDCTNKTASILKNNLDI